MVDTIFRKLDSSIVTAAVVAALAIACGSGAAGYFVGVRHAESRAAVQVEELQDKALAETSAAKIALARVSELARQFESQRDEVKAY